MKIIKESKQEKLPIDFITQFVSNGWEEVGNLKASIEGIKHEFSNTAGVVDILQNLIDSYLIAIGQMEMYLNDKNYLDMPSDKDLKEGLADCDILSDEPVNKPETVRAELPEYDVEVEQNGNSVEIEITPEADKNEITNDLSLDTIKYNFTPSQEDDTEKKIFQSGDFKEYGKDVDLKAHEISEPFEYFVEFDEPNIDDNERSDYSAWMHHIGK